LLINRLKDLADGASPITRPELTQLVVRFLESFDGRQIRYVGDLYLELIHELVKCKWVPVRYLFLSKHAPCADSECQGPQAVGLLASAILRIDPTSQMLTSSHCHLAELAYESRQFEAALPVIGIPYVYVPGMKNQTDPQHFGDSGASPAAFISTRTNLTENLSKDAIMKYDTTCGMIFADLGRWKDAHAAFSRVVAFPSRDGSVILAMASAYKKMVFSSLLAYGRLAPLPHVHGATPKQYQTAAKAYHDVANVFMHENVEKLKNEVYKYSQEWSEDGNVALVQLVMEGYQKWQIIALGDIYSKISISEVRELTKSAVTGKRLPTDEAVETLIVGMISTGLLNGVVMTHTDGKKYLSFLPQGGEITESEFAAELKRSVARMQALAKIVQSTDTRLLTHKDHIKFIHRELKQTDADSHMDAGFGFDQSIEDEDLMVGISQD
jgi:COP9 signalosome complex subunit 3